MDKRISRRSMLAGTGCLGAAGLMRILPAWAQAAAAPAGTQPVCLSMYYMSGNDAKFDRMQYREQHVPLLRQIYGDSLDRIELRTPPPRTRKPPSVGHADYAAPEPPVLAVESLWIRKLDAFAAATRDAGSKIADDMGKITRARVTAQYEQLAASQGEPRESITQGTKCFSSLYPAKDAGTWDTEYYSKTVLPLLNELYGPDALRRVEVCKGVSAPGGGPPAITSAVHLYLKSEQVFMSKGMNAGKRLMGEGPKYTNIMPVASTYDVYAVG